MSYEKNGSDGAAVVQFGGANRWCKSVAQLECETPHSCCARQRERDDANAAGLECER